MDKQTKGRKRGEKEGYNPEVRKVGIRVHPVHCTVGQCTRVGELLKVGSYDKNSLFSGTDFCTRDTGKNFLVLSSDLSRWVLPLSGYVLPLGES